MKRYLFALAASALMSAPALYAQSTTQTPAPAGDHRWGGGPGEHGPGMMRMYEQLNLTDAQKAQIKTIHEKYRAQMPKMDTAAMRAQHDQMQQQMRAHMEAARPVMERERAEIRAVLNADQQKKFDDMQAQMQTRMRDRMKQQGPPPNGQ